MSDPNAKLAGVLPVFQTPYHQADESIDADTLEKEIHWLFDQGADGIVMAMVSEILRLASDERRQLAELACRFARSRGSVVISVGAESTHTALQYAHHACACGADGLMAIPPLATTLSDDALAGYYRSIIEAVDIPVIVQDASSYVGQPMSIDLQAKLLEQYGPQRVQFKPEATPIGPNLSALHDATAGQARVFEGTGGIALIDSYKRGIVGTMPGADLIDAVVALWQALEADDPHRAERIHAPLAAIITMQTSLDAFLAIEKYLLVKRGIFKNTHVRTPTGYTLDQETKAQVDRLFAKLTAAVAYPTNQK